LSFFAVDRSDVDAIHFLHAVEVFEVAVLGPVGDDRLGLVRGDCQRRLQFAGRSFIDVQLLRRRAEAFGKVIEHGRIIGVRNGEALLGHGGDCPVPIVPALVIRGKHLRPVTARADALGDGSAFSFR
jgi:hypothetical protein